MRAVERKLEALEGPLAKVNLSLAWALNQVNVAQLLRVQ